MDIRASFSHVTRWLAVLGSACAVHATEDAASVECQLSWIVRLTGSGAAG